MKLNVSIGFIALTILNFDFVEMRRGTPPELWQTYFNMYVRLQEGMKV